MQSGCNDVCQVDESYSFSMESRRTRCAVWRIHHSELNDCWPSYMYLQKHDSTRYKWVRPTQWIRLTKLWSNSETRQCSSNINHGSVNALPFSCLIQHILVYFCCNTSKKFLIKRHLFLLEKPPPQNQASPRLQFVTPPAGPFSGLLHPDVSSSEAVLQRRQQLTQSHASSWNDLQSWTLLMAERMNMFCFHVVWE